MKKTVFFVVLLALASFCVEASFNRVAYEGLFSDNSGNLYNTTLNVTMNYTTTSCTGTVLLSETKEVTFVNGIPNGGINISAAIPISGTVYLTIEVNGSNAMCYESFSTLHAMKANNSDNLAGHNSSYYANISVIGTLTDTKYCTWDDTAKSINCTSAGGGVGNTTAEMIAASNFSGLLLNWSGIGDTYNTSTQMRSEANYSGLLLNWTGIGDTYNTSTQMRNEALTALGSNVSNNNASIAYLFSQITNFLLDTWNTSTQMRTEANWSGLLRNWTGVGDTYNTSAEMRAQSNFSGLLINWTGVGDTWNTTEQMQDATALMLQNTTGTYLWYDDAGNTLNVTLNYTYLSTLYAAKSYVDLIATNATNAMTTAAEAGKNASYINASLSSYALKSYCDNIAGNVTTTYAIAGRAENTANISNKTANIANDTANALKAINPWSNVKNLTGLTPSFAETNFTGNVNMSGKDIIGIHCYNFTSGGSYCDEP